MKKLTSLLSIILVCTVSWAQSDTSAYNTQRIKINQLLDQRSSRFSQYDNSLTRRSGIFGLKTKRDMQASNDILTQIVLTDNNIFEELKILPDFKDFEKKEVEHRVETVEGRIARFQTTITRLQQENDKLKAGNEILADRADSLITYLAFATLVALIAITYTVRLKKLRKVDI